MTVGAVQTVYDMRARTTIEKTKYDAFSVASFYDYFNEHDICLFDCDTSLLHCQFLFLQKKIGKKMST